MQLYEAAGRDLGGLEITFASGNFAPLFDWLHQRVHVQVRRFTAAKLTRRATGSRSFMLD